MRIFSFILCFVVSMFGSKYQIMWQHILRTSQRTQFLFKTIDARLFQLGFNKDQTMIINRCSFLIFLKFYINDNSLLQILKVDHIYQETYQLNLDDDKVTIKLISNQSIDVAENIAEAFNNNYIIQFEYIYTSYILLDLYYDIFDVNERIL